MSERDAWRADAQELKQTLSHATTERDKRPDFAPVSGELGWVIYERNIMHDAVNRMRARYGKPPVARDEIAWVETRACGHIDYVAKYAYGAADLVHAPDHG
jgi:hypothetical protein